MLRRAVIPALLLACGGCVMDPSRPYLGGIGDPVRGAALNAPWIFGDMSRYQGNPAGAAQAAAQLEFLTDALLNDPAWAPQTSGSLQGQMRVARAELRAALGIAPDAPPAQVIQGLRTAGDALAQGSRARAEVALSPPVFLAGGAETITRLGSLPRMQSLNIAANMAANAFNTMNRRF